MYQPLEPLHPIISPEPFMKWGIGIVWKFPHASGGRVFMLATTIYFSKWIKFAIFVKVREKEVISSIKCNVLTRFCISSEIVCLTGVNSRCQRLQIPSPNQDLCSSPSSIPSTRMHEPHYGHQRRYVWPGLALRDANCTTTESPPKK